MNSELIIDTWKAKDPDPLLWPDHDRTLLSIPFQSVNQEFDKLALVHWWMNVYNPANSTPMEIYQSWHEAVRHTFKHVFPGMGYHPGSMQNSISLGMYKNDEVEPAVEELKLWLPHIKLIDCPEDGDRESYKGQHIHVSEHTFSEKGVYSLLIFAENDSVLNKRVYGSDTYVHSFKSLGHAVAYIRDRHWLGKHRK